MEQKAFRRSPRRPSQHTNNLFPGSIASLSCFPPLSIQLLTPIEEDTPGADKCKNSRRPGAIPSHPILYPVGEPTGVAQVLSVAHGRAHL
jgi:hypothetical protein